MTANPPRPDTTPADMPRRSRGVLRVYVAEPASTAAPPCSVAALGRVQSQALNMKRCGRGEAP